MAKPKSTGYVSLCFYDDGTYDSYLSTVNFTGEYTVKGNKLTLTNPKTSGEVVYKYKVKGKFLPLLLLKMVRKLMNTNLILLRNLK